MQLRRVGIISTALVATAAATSAALAAQPEPGASYKGELAQPRSEVKIAFRVSSNGRRVTRLRLSDMPNYCRDSGKAKPMRFPRARVSNMGTFRSTNIKRFGSGERRGEMRVRVRITGRFVSSDLVMGRVTTNWTAAADPDLCDGGDEFMAGANRRR